MIGKKEAKSDVIRRKSTQVKLEKDSYKLRRGKKDLIGSR